MRTCRTHTVLSLSAVSLLAAGLAAGLAAAGDPPAGEDGSRLDERTVRTVIATIRPAGEQGGVAGPECVPQSIQYTALDFESQMPQGLTLQAGFVEQEIAAVEFQIPADDFPLIVRGSDMVFAQNHLNTTITEWTWMVWEGPPTDDNLVASFASDDVILPHILLPFQGAMAVDVRVEVDPKDPEQVLIMNESGSNSVTIGYRIDMHNNQSGNGCITLPPPSSNAFPTTDTNASEPDFPALNWLGAIDCGPLGCPAGFTRFSELPNGPFIDCRPSGDWNMRINYEPINCAPGACCLPDQSCFLAEGTDCLGQGGSFQGSNTLCELIECPETTGACCVIDTADCFPEMTDPNCQAIGGQWVGPNTSCVPGCDTEGACCFDDDSCTNLSGVFCGTFGGTFKGFGTDCEIPGFVCDPLGACCLPDGSCLDDQTPGDCESAAGTFQGDGVVCDGSCPQPLGACCASGGGCGDLSEATCAGIPGAFWAGPLTTCDDMPDPCTQTPCPGDANDDGVVDVQDLVLVITTWGVPGGAGDVTGDGDVDVQDVVAVITGWGKC